MQSEWKRKASAGHLTPGFFRFAFAMVVAIIVAGQPASSQGQRLVRSMTIAGNVSISSAVIAQWMESRSGRPFIGSDVQTITSRYAGEGFPQARIDSVSIRPVADSSQIDVTLWITEGKPACVGSILFEGNKVLDEAAVRSMMRTSIGRTFVPAELEQDIGALLNAYEKSGYPFAKISVIELDFRDRGDSLSADILLKIEEGMLARINHVRVEGNSNTKTSFIVREARLTDGEVFRGDQPEKVRQRLQKLQLFSSVSSPELFIHDDGTVGLSLKVTEGNPNRFDGIIGYMPASGAGDGYVTGLADIQFRNMFGTGRKLSVRWFRETQSSQEIDLQYREPWMASLPVNAELGFYQRKQDSTYIRSSFRFSADLMATDQISLGLVVSTEQVTPTEGFGRQIVSDNRSIDVGFAVAYDSRDDPVTPTSGFNYRTEYVTGYKQISTSPLVGQSNRSALQRLSFDFELAVSPLDKQVLDVNVSARDFRSGGVEVSDLFRLGGATSLRGYREGQFLGSRIAWTNLEYRLLAGQRSYAFAFVDAGYVQTPDRPEVGLSGQDFSRVGYGAGLRVDTPLGLIGVSFAFGKGDTFGTAKLHLRLASEF